MSELRNPVIFSYTWGRPSPLPYDRSYTQRARLTGGILQASASFLGTGTLTANIREISLHATLNGSGTFIADIHDISLYATFTGAGILISNATVLSTSAPTSRNPIFSYTWGRGEYPSERSFVKLGQIAGGVVFASASFTGAGNFVSSSFIRVVGSASFIGSGTLIGASLQLVSASFTGSGAGFINANVTLFSASSTLTRSPIFSLRWERPYPPDNRAWVEPPSIGIDTSTPGQVNVIFPFVTSAQGFIATPGASATLAWDGTTGNPPGSLSSSLTARNIASSASTWTRSLTWQDLGVPPGATVTSIINGSMQYYCQTFTSGGANHLAGPVTIQDGATTATVSASFNFTNIGSSFASSAGTNLTGLALPSSDTVTITINNTLSTANAAGAVMTLKQDQLAFTITYKNLNISATFYGIGALASTASERIVATAQFNGSGTLIGNATLAAGHLVFASATLPGTGSFANYGPVSLSVTSAAALGELALADPTILRSQSFPAPAGQILMITPLPLLGVGQLNTLASLISVTNLASLTGSGTLIGDAQRIIAYRPSGSIGSFAIGEIPIGALPPFIFINASLFGTGTFASYASLLIRVTSTLLGVGTISSAPILIEQASSTFLGIGTITAVPTVIPGLVTRFLRRPIPNPSGTGFSRKILFIRSARIIQTLPIQATLRGSGTLTVNFRSNITRRIIVDPTGNIRRRILFVPQPGGMFINIAASFPGMGAGSIYANAIFGNTVAVVGPLNGNLIIQPNPNLLIVGRSTLNGSGTLSASITSFILAITSTFTGLGTLGSRAFILVSAGSTFNGTGLLSVSSIELELIASIFTGSGTFNSSALVVGSITSTLNGSSTLIGDALPQQFGSAFLNGSGALTSQAIGIEFTSSSFFGSGSFIANAIPEQFLSSVLNGLGNFTSSVVVILVDTATFNGTGTLIGDAQPQQFIGSTLTGSGAFASFILEINLASAAFNAAGTFISDSIVQNFATATFNGSGNLSSVVVEFAQISFLANGTGTLIGDAQPQQFISSTLIGSGVLNSLAVELEIITAAFNGSGSFNSSVAVLSLINASLFGTGALSASAVVIAGTNNFLIVESLIGLGQFNAVANLIEVDTATFNGTGTLIGDALPQQFISSTLNGSGTFTSSVLSISSITSTLNGSSTLIGDALPQQFGSSLFNGSGQFNEVDTLIEAITSTLNGSGTLIGNAIPEQFISLTFNGTGTGTFIAVTVQLTSASFGGIGTLIGDALPQQFGSSLFNGSGTFTSAAFDLIQANSLLLGQGTLIGDALPQTFTTSNLLGLGSFIGSSLEIVQGIANIPGVGIFVADSIVQNFAIATLNGSGTLYLDISHYAFGSSTFSGSSILIANTIESLQASFIGSGTFISDSRRITLAGASFNGTSTLQVDALVIAGVNNFFIVDTLIGLGSFNVTTNYIGSITATFNGTGTLTGSVLPVRFILASFFGNGTLFSISGPLNLVAAITSTLNGAGTVIVNPVPQLIESATAPFAGSGNFASTTNLIELGYANFPAFGILVADTLPPINFASASLSGAGTIIVDSISILPASTSFSGQGTLNVIVLRIPANQTPFDLEAAFFGNGTITSNLILNGLILSNFFGIGNLQAVANQNYPIGSALNGIGNLNAQGNEALPALGSFGGLGALAASAILVLGMGASLLGSGALAADAQPQTISQKEYLLGDSVLTAHPSVIVTNASPAIFNGGGELDVNFVQFEVAQSDLSGIGTFSSSILEIELTSASLNGQGTLYLNAHSLSELLEPDPDGIMISELVNSILISRGA